jgi:hypothetical protein
VPGLGHFYQGRTGKGWLYAICILGLYFLGFAMGEGKITSSLLPNDADTVRALRHLLKRILRQHQFRGRHNLLPLLALLLRRLRIPVLLHLLRLPVKEAAGAETQRVASFRPDSSSIKLSSTLMPLFGLSRSGR